MIPSLDKFSLMAIRALALTGAVIAGYLTWVTLTHGTVAACGGQASTLACDDVLRSHWSRAIGIPVSVLGVIVYAAIFVTSYRLSRPSRFAKSMGHCFLTLITTAFASAVWFLLLQIVVIRHICPFCLLIHFSGISIAGIVFTTIGMESIVRNRRSGLEAIQRLTLGDLSSAKTQPVASRESTRRLPWWLLITCFLLLSLILIQVFFPTRTFELFEPSNLLTDVSLEGSFEPTEVGLPQDEQPLDTSIDDASTPATTASPPQMEDLSGHSVEPAIVQQSSSSPLHIEAAVTKSSESEPSRRVVFLKGRLKIDLRQHGLLGSPQADKVVIELVDYTCPDCRKMHQQLKTAREHFRERLAVVVFPVPLETTCNRYIRTTHHKHVGACKYAELALAVFKAAPNKFESLHDWLMDSEQPPPFDRVVRHAKELVGPDFDASQIRSSRLQDYVRLFGVTNVQRLPAMIVGDEFMVGVPQSAHSIIQAIEAMPELR